MSPDQFRFRNVERATDIFRLCSPASATALEASLNFIIVTVPDIIHRPVFHLKLNSAL
jgi:hypothetical protein